MALSSVSKVIKLKGGAFAGKRKTFFGKGFTRDEERFQIAQYKGTNLVATISDLSAMFESMYEDLSTFEEKLEASQRAAENWVLHVYKKDDKKWTSRESFSFVGTYKLEAVAKGRVSFTAGIPAKAIDPASPYAAPALIPA